MIYIPMIIGLFVLFSVLSSLYPHVTTAGASVNDSVSTYYNNSVVARNYSEGLYASLANDDVTAITKVYNSTDGNDIGTANFTFDAQSGIVYLSASATKAIVNQTVLITYNYYSSRGIPILSTGFGQTSGFGYILIGGLVIFAIVMYIRVGKSR